MPGLRGGSSFTGAGSFSVGVSGAGNVNGNAAMDGSISQGGNNEDVDMGMQNDDNWQQEMNNRDNSEVNEETGGIINFDQEKSRNIDNNDVMYGSHQYGNVNAQTGIQQNGVANSNAQGAIMQQAYRRQNNPILHNPNQHIVCGYRYRIIYPSQQLQNSNLENEIAQSGLVNSNGETTSVGQFEERREFSGPFNHLL